MRENVTDKAKTALRLLPVDMYDIGTIEGWLTDMAAKGLVFKSAWGVFFTFIKGEPQNLAYRLEPEKKGCPEPTGDMLDLFSQMGWEFAARLNNGFYLFYSAAAEPGELHTDPTLQAAGLKRAVRNNILGFIFLLLILGAYAVMIFTAVAGEKTPLVELIKGGSWEALFLILLMILALAETGLQTAKFISYYRRLKNGAPPRRNGHRAMPVSSLAGIGLVLLLCLFWILRFAEIGDDTVFSIDKYEGRRYLPTVIEISGRDDLEVQDFEYDGVNWASYLVTEKDMLAPIIQELDQDVREVYNKDGERISVTGLYMELKLKFIAEAALQELSQSAPGGAQEIELPDVDRAYYAVNDRFETLILMKDTRLAQITLNENGSRLLERAQWAARFVFEGE